MGRIRFCAAKAGFGEELIGSALLSVAISRGGAGTYVESAEPREKEIGREKEAGFCPRTCRAKVPALAGDASAEAIRHCQTTGFLCTGIATSKLADHLMILYGRGALALDEQGDLLKLFFSKAPLEVRLHALGFVGRTLQAEEGQIPPVVIGRFRLLWDRRIETLRATAQQPEWSELSAFGSWFACGKFDQRWALDRLQESLELSGWTEPDHLVVEHLAATAAGFPKDVVACLSMLVDGDKNGWDISSWREYATTILRTALDSGVEDARTCAAALISRP